MRPVASEVFIQRFFFVVAKKFADGLDGQNLAVIQRQLSGWSKTGRITQLRRGLYSLPQHNPHPFVVANRLVPGSYVSLQMALAYYHLIPEHVATVTSVTTRRPGKYENRFGRFSYRHISPSLFFGIEYRLLTAQI